jgi:Tfp pilus assembly protein PilF
VELAIEAYRAALKELPEDPDVANNLAYLLTTRPAGCEEAAKLATTAVGLAEKYRISGSRKKSYWDTLGCAQLCLHHYKEAEAAFKTGLAIDRDAMNLNIGHAEALEGLGQIVDAQKVIDRIGTPQGLSPDLSRRLNEVRERLKRRDDSLTRG